MRNYKQYNRYGKESKVFAAVVLVVFLLLIVFCILTLLGMFDEPLWQPNVSYPMANANISWMQSFYGGVF